MPPNQTRVMLIVASVLFALFALTVGSGMGGNPATGIVIASAMVLMIVSAAASRPASSGERDSQAL